MSSTGSRRNIDATQPRIYRAGPRWDELTVISEIHRLVTHWDVREGRSRLCAGMRCELCSVGAQKLARYYMMLVDARGKDWILELRERHMDEMERFESAAGLVIRIRKEGTASNSPVTVKVVGERTVVVRDIGRLVARFGLAPIEGAVIDGADEVVDRLLTRKEWEPEDDAEPVANPPGFEDFE